MSTKEVVKADEFELQPETAKPVQTSFNSKDGEIEILLNQYNEVIKAEMSPMVSKKARDIRLKMVKYRSEIKEIHKTQKQQALQFGKFVDAIKRAKLEPVLQAEEKLKYIEEYEERLRIEREAKLEAQRTAELQSFDLVSIPDHIGTWDDLTYKSYLKGVKLQYKEDKQKEAEAEAERQRQEQIQKLRQERELDISEYRKQYNSWKAENPDFDLGTIGHKEYTALKMKFESQVKKEKEEQEKYTQMLSRKAEIAKYGGEFEITTETTEHKFQEMLSKAKKAYDQRQEEEAKRQKELEEARQKEEARLKKEQQEQKDKDDAKKLEMSEKVKLLTDADWKEQDGNYVKADQMIVASVVNFSKPEILSSIISDKEKLIKPIQETLFTIEEGEETRFDKMLSEITRMIDMQDFKQKVYLQKVKILKNAIKEVQ